MTKPTPACTCTFLSANCVPIGGCNKRTMKNHTVEEPCMKALLQKWEQYVATFEEKPRTRKCTWVAERLHFSGLRT